MLTLDEWRDEGLSKGQAQVADLICSGKTNKEIAEIRGSKISAVKQLVTLINAKLKTKSRIAIVLYSVSVSNRKSQDAALLATARARTSIEDHPLNVVLPSGR